MHPLTGNQLPKVGTAGLVSSMQMRGLLSTRNYAAGQYEDFEQVSGERLAEEFNIKNAGCLTCPTHCARTVMVQVRSVKGPELETLGLLDGNICNNDLQKILDWNCELDELAEGSKRLSEKYGGKEFAMHTWRPSPPPDSVCSLPTLSSPASC